MNALLPVCGWCHPPKKITGLQAAMTEHLCANHQKIADQLTREVTGKLLLPPARTAAERIESMLTAAPLIDLPHAPWATTGTAWKSDEAPPVTKESMIAAMKKILDRPPPATLEEVVLDQLNLIRFFPVGMEQLAMQIAAVVRTFDGPQPESTSHEYEVRWHEDDPDAIRLDQQQISRISEAEKIGRSKIGLYGIRFFTLYRREHRTYSDGSGWHGPWIRVGDSRTMPPP